MKASWKLKMAQEWPTRAPRRRAPRGSQEGQKAKITSKKLPRLSKMAQEASKTAQETPKTPPYQPQKAKIIEKNNGFSMIFRIRRYSAMEAPRGPKMALKLPKMVPQRPRDAPRRGQERPKRASWKLKMAQEWPTRAPRTLQEGPQERPKRGRQPR